MTLVRDVAERFDEEAKRAGSVLTQCLPESVKGSWDPTRCRGKPSWSSDHLQARPWARVGFARRNRLRQAGMDFGAALDALPHVQLSPREKLLQALEMYEDGVAMQRLNLSRRHPELTPTELEARLLRWLARSDEAR